MTLMEKKLLEHFTKTNSKKKVKENLDFKKIKKKDNKLYVKWKGYSDSFNSCIDKGDII